MEKRDIKDIIGGAALIVIGAAITFHSVTSLQLGTISNMGPGLFPTGLSVILAGFGIMLLVPALFRAGTAPKVRIWTPLFVLAGIGVFALVIQPLGLLPAILAVTIISSFAELKFRPVSLALLCACLCLLAWLVFHVGLGLAIPMLRWPF